VATQRIFDFAQNTIPVVFASSSSVYGNADSYPVSESNKLKPISPYGLTKKTCEELAQIYRDQFGLQSIALRYFTVYGPGQRPDMAFTKICSSLITGKAFTINGSGNQVRDFTFVSDAVSATIAAMDGPRVPVYNVGGGHEISLNGVIELFEDISGRKLNVEYIEPQAGDVTRTGANTELLTSSTSWRAKVLISEGVELQWNWAKSNLSLF
jgi:nucleoside-diphosphate-sugar epimerase